MYSIQQLFSVRKVTCNKNTTPICIMCGNDIKKESQDDYRLIPFETMLESIWMRTQSKINDKILVAFPNSPQTICHMYSLLGEGICFLFSFSIYVLEGNWLK